MYDEPQTAPSSDRGYWFFLQRIKNVVPCWCSAKYFLSVIIKLYWFPPLLVSSLQTFRGHVRKFLLVLTSCSENSFVSCHCHAMTSFASAIVPSLTNSPRDSAPHPSLSIHRVEHRETFLVTSAMFRFHLKTLTMCVYLSERIEWIRGGDGVRKR